jgi:leader peptidase (prepilin peptidase)/N-methyltransferase
MSFTAVDVAVGVWLFAIGGAVGSFLNVVIYRLPAGMSLVQPGSHCPRCKRPIRWYDNVPIIGWLVLGGRCRDCRESISMRYPAVEAATALVFLGLGGLEFLSEGANLPARPAVMSDGLAYPPLGTGELGGILAYHLLLVSTLLAAGLIAYDGHLAPRRLWWPALVAGGIAPLVWPHLRPVPAWPGLEGWLAGLTDGGAGLVVGLLLGRLAATIWQARDRLGLIVTFGAVGLFLGWQAVVAIAVASTAIRFPVRVVVRLCPSWNRLPPTMWLALTTLVWLFAWKPLFAHWPLMK